MLCILNMYIREKSTSSGSKRTMMSESLARTGSWSLAVELGNGRGRLVESRLWNLPLCSSGRQLDGYHINVFMYGEVFLLFSARTVAVLIRELHPLLQVKAQNPKAF